MNITKIILTIVAVVLIVDFLGFTAWVASGQQPVDNFYVGSITTHALRAVLK